MRWLVLGLAIAGCASAGKGNSIIGGLSDAGDDRGRTDANDFPALDAAVIDAPQQQITLNQTASSTVTRGNSFACQDTQTGVTAQNSYYRVFSLDDYAITTPLHVTQVDFAIQLADAGPDSTRQPAQLVVGSYGAVPTGTTLDLAQIDSIAKADIMIPDGAGTRMTVAIAGDIAPGSRLIVELDVPDGTDAASAFIIGSNAQGERQPGYMAAPDCMLAQPTTLASIAAQHMAGDVDIIMTVTGTH